MSDVAQQPSKPTAWDQIIIDAMGWHPSENGPSYGKTRDDLIARIAALRSTDVAAKAPMQRALVIEECAKIADKLAEWFGEHQAFLAEDAVDDCARKIRALALSSTTCECEHKSVHDGPRVEMRWGTAPTQVCDCGMWRTNLHVPGVWRSGPISSPQRGGL